MNNEKVNGIVTAGRAETTRRCGRPVRVIRAAWAASGFVLAGATTMTSIAATIHVPRNYADIQSAINASSNGDVIEIAAGTYTPNATLNTFGKAVTIRGAVNSDGTPATIIDGLNNKRVLQCVSGESASTIFNNLVVTRGFSNRGGGMHLMAASPTLRNCTLSANSTPSAFGTSSQRGGGIYVEGANPTFQDCRFIGNAANSQGGMGGALCIISSSPKIVNCDFSSNTASSQHGAGAAIYMEASAPILDHCELSGNSASSDYGTGGGIHLQAASPTLRSCVIRNNYAYSGGGLFLYNVSADTSHPVLYSTVICSNSSQISGGGQIDAGGNCISSNCTGCDADGDSIFDGFDNCPATPNTNQADCDGDGFGDVCQSATRTSTTGNVAPFGNGVIANGFLEPLVPTATNVMVTVRARGDLGSPTEFIWVSIGGILLDTSAFGVGGTDCPTTPDVATYWVSSSAWNSALAKQTGLTVSVGSSPLVDAEQCGVSALLQIDVLYQPFPILDCNQDGNDDTCDPLFDPSDDCNQNGLIDFCELGDGTVADKDADGIIDDCEYAYGDFDLDGTISAPDLAFILAVWAFPKQVIGDLDNDGSIGATDLATLLSRWGPVP